MTDFELNKFDQNAVCPRRKLLLATITLGRGGAERHLVRIANSLAKHHEVHIATIHAGGSYESLVSNDVTIHHVGSAWSQHSTLVACHFAARKLSSIIDVVKPDCVISFLEPVTHTCHRAKKRSRHSFIHIVATQNNLDRVLQSMEGWIMWPIHHGIKEAIKDSDGIIAISDGVAGNICELFPEAVSKTRTVYNAAFDEVPNITDATETPNSILGSPEKTFKIVACGRLSEQKGFCDLLTAFRKVRDQLDAKLEVLGTGPLLETLEKQALKLGIADDVTFIGFQEKPLDHFRDADLFVLSSWWEGFGNVIVEAMSVGTPVVSTDCPYGPSEIISHGVNGLLAPPRKPDQLAEQIVIALKNGDLRKKLSANSLQRAKDFTSDKIAANYATVIEEAIARKQDS